jgi:hypothetical protein
MTNEGQAQEVHATVISSGHSQEPGGRDRAQRFDIGDDDEVIDPDAVIIEETPAVLADDESSSVPADDEASSLLADDEASSVPADDEAFSMPTDDEASSVSADDEAFSMPTDDDTSSRAAGEPGRDRVAGIPAATAIPEAARRGMPADTSAPAGSGGPGDTGVRTDAEIFGDPEKLRQQWSAIQSTFVDDPRGSVAAAAELVSETIAALVASAQERERGMRGEWDRDGVDTEGLRNALRSYRGLLDALVRR